MSNYTTNLDQLLSSQAGKEITCNELIDSLSPASLFGRHASQCAGLTWAYYGGYVNVNGVITLKNNGTLTLTASSSNYIECDSSGTVYVNTTAFTAGMTPLYLVTTGASSVTNWTDYRLKSFEEYPLLSKDVSASGIITLTQIESNCKMIKLTGTITSDTTIIFPIFQKVYIVKNLTSGAFTMTLRCAGGTGITIASGETKTIFTDGIDVNG